MSAMFYTGVGSRETPFGVRVDMIDLAKSLRIMGFKLRSGGADGADGAFDHGARPDSHIYFPWPGFNGLINCRLARPTTAAYNMAAMLHPTWERLSTGARALHARNCHQVLGDDLQTPSRFLVAWTPDGCVDAATRTRKTGGTATAIVLAAKHNVPVFNLFSASVDDVMNFAWNLL